MKKAVLAILAAVLYSCGGPSARQDTDVLQSMEDVTAEINGATTLKTDNSTKTVTYGGFRMEVPDIADDYGYLDPESEITYGDTISGIHLGVYKMDKKELSDFIKNNSLESVVTPDLYGYNKLCMANVASGQNESQDTKVVSGVAADTSVVNGMKRIHNSFTIEINGTDFENNYVFAEGGDVFYMIYFSMPMSGSGKYYILRDKVLGSFRENQ